MRTFPVGASAMIEELSNDPHPLFDRLRATEPVSWVPVLGGWIVTSRELAAEVMRDSTRFTVDHPAFTTARVVGPSMLSLDGPAHSRHRDPFAPSFRLSAMRDRFEGRVVDAARRLVRGVHPLGHAELRRGVAGPLAVEVVADLLGLMDVDPVELLAVYERIVGAVTALSMGDPMPDSGPEAVERLRRLIDTSVAGGRSMLAEVAHHLTGDEVRSNAAVMLFGGIETSEGMTANALWHAFTFDSLPMPDPVDVGEFVEESLRLEPAAARVDRYATTDVDLAGATIAAGDLVIVSLSAANRDPAMFDQPHAFRSGRPRGRQHLAFAQGPPTCIGLHLARMETIAALEAVFEVFDDIDFDMAASSGPTGLVFQKPGAVWARWKTA